MRKAGFLAIIALALAPLLPAQHVLTHTASRFRLAASAPATCNPGDVYYDTVTTLSYSCTALNTWSAFGTGVAGSFITAASAPATCSVGDVYFNTTNTTPYYCSAPNTWSLFGITDHTALSNIGTNSHAQVDSHIVATVAHGATGAVVGTTNTQSLTNKTIIDYSNDIHATATHTRVRNDTAGLLTKGTPVYITGYNAGLDVVTVAAAKADSNTTLPAIGLLEADLAKNVTGESLGIGVMLNVKTDHAGWAVGDKLWVSTATAGTLTKTRPTGSTNFVQRMGLVLRRHASLGIIEIIGAHRANSLPLDIDAGLILSGTLPLARLDTPAGYWRSYTVAYTASEFEAADTDAAVDLFTLPANGVIEAIRIKHSVAFAGTAVTSVACSVGDAAGDTADDDAYMPAFNVFQAVGNTVADFDGGALSTTAASQTVQLHCVANVNFGDGAGTTALTAGSVDVHLKWSVLP